MNARARQHCSRDVLRARPCGCSVCCWRGLAGCASVPDSSPVQVLRQVGGDEAAPPPGPVDGSNPLDLVRDFVTASGSSTDKHAAARAFLAPEAAKWDDTTGVTVLDGQFDTVPAPGAPDSSTGGHHHPDPRHPDGGSPRPGRSSPRSAVPVGRRRRPSRRAVADLPAARRRRRAPVDLPGRLPHRARLVRRPHATAGRRRRAVRAQRARQGAGRPRDRPIARRAVQRAGRGRRPELQPGARLRSNVAASPDGAARRRPDPHRRPRRHRPTAARRADRVVARRGQRRRGCGCSSTASRWWPTARSGAVTTSPRPSPTCSPAPTFLRWS